MQPWDLVYEAIGGTPEIHPNTGVLNRDFHPFQPLLATTPILKSCDTVKVVGKTAASNSPSTFRGIYASSGSPLSSSPDSSSAASVSSEASVEGSEWLFRHNCLGLFRSDVLPDGLIIGSRICLGLFCATTGTNHGLDRVSVLFKTVPTLRTDVFNICHGGVTYPFIRIRTTQHVASPLINMVAFSFHLLYRESLW